MVAPLLIPIVSMLAEKGMALLSSAVQAKGKEAVEKLIGTKLPEMAAQLTPELAATLREKEMEHEEELLKLSIEKERLSLEGEKAAAEAVTKRWEADMLSDSWLSKNVRPLSLIHTFLVLDLLMVCALFGKTVDGGYLSLLKELLMLMVGAYFLGRTVEKGVDLYQGWKQTKGE